jgi:hypothetical protein
MDGEDGFPEGRQVCPHRERRESGPTGRSCDAEEGVVLSVGRVVAVLDDVHDLEHLGFVSRRIISGGAADLVIEHD